MRHLHSLFLATVLSLTLSAGCGDEKPASGVIPSPAQPSARASTQAGGEPTSSGFDVEAWRQEAIERFGEEPKYKDGSQLDYVVLARQVCAFEDRPAYDEGSLQEFIVETFCPNVAE